MADIVLAECNGNFWLIHGDQHVNELMLNTLDPAITVSFVDCGTAAEAHGLWETRTSGDFELQAPWMINPKVIRRIKGTFGQGAFAFSPWSALLDAEAQAVIAVTAEWLRVHAPGRIVMRQFRAPEPTPGLPDLQRLRAQLVAGAFAQAGADPAAIDHQTAPAASPTDVDRVEFVTLT